VTGPHLNKLAGYTERILEGMRGTHGLVDVDTTLSLRQPELRVDVNREKASDLGIKVGQIADTLHTFVGGERVSKYREEGEQYDVWLRAAPGHRDDPQVIGDLRISTPAASSCD